MENKNQKVWVTVLLSTLLFITIIFIGMGYAFFTANNPEGSTAQIISETGRMVINYDDGTDIIQPVTGIVPSNAILVNKTFSLTGSNTTVGMSEGDGLPMPYKVGVKYTSTFSDGMMHYYIKEVNRPTNSNVTVNYVITPETGKTEDDYKNQTVPGNDTYTGYTHGTFKNGKNYTEMVTGEFPASLNDQTITFNLIIQFPDNNENQDSEKGKTFNGKVVVNYEAPQPKSFAEDTWETIAENTSSDVYNVGDTRQVLIDNKTYTVRIANNTTPAECNDSNFSQTTCGFVVEFADIVENRQMNSTSTNAGGWEASEMRTYANGEFYNKLPEDLRNVIIDTKVVSGHGSTTGETNFTTTDKIYLLSSHEVWEDGTSNQVSSNDTTWDKTRQLDYYANLGVTTSNYSGAIKKNNGSNSRWWLRAANSGSGGSFLGVNGSGNWATIYANNTRGFAPAFRIG
ncbi:MAG: hypothetical protein J6K23_00740 [Bacilli bacterium]|nr:hypothetical protein [Bacilli bacterium]